jgi:DNA-binding CsgD family transcriptional regulator
MRAVGALASVLDTVYAPEPDNDRWLDGIRTSVSVAFDGHAGAHAYTVRVTESAIMLEGVSAAEPFRSAIAATHQIGDAHEMRRAYLRRAGMRTSREFDRDNPGIRYQREMGVADILGTFGFADHGRICAVSFAMCDPAWRVSRGARFALDRLSAHLAASWRLRIRAEPEDEAVLSPSGAVLDAQGAARSMAARRRLRDAALVMVRAKRERDPIAALAFWTAMVEGRWTLVERFDSDGKRLLLARRNAPETFPHRALTEKERLVVERASLGVSLQLVAYELGWPRSTVSDALARAMKKLGVRDRAELVELYASLAG